MPRAKHDVHTSLPRPFAKEHEDEAPSASFNTARAPSLSPVPSTRDTDRMDHASVLGRQWPAAAVRIPHFGSEAVASVLHAVEKAKLVRPAILSSPPQIRPNKHCVRSREEPASSSKVAPWLNQIFSQTLGPTGAASSASPYDGSVTSIAYSTTSSKDKAAPSGARVESGLRTTRTAAAPLDIALDDAVSTRVRRMSLDLKAGDGDSSGDDTVDGDDRGDYNGASYRRHHHCELRRQSVTLSPDMRRRRSFVRDEQMAQYQNPREKPAASHTSRHATSSCVPIAPGAHAGRPAPPPPCAELAEGAEGSRLTRKRASTIDGALLLSLKGEAPEAVATRHWELVRQKLWRLLNPAAAFSRIIRRALFVHRVTRVLHAIPCFAHKTVAELAAMTNGANELALPRYTYLYRDQTIAEGLYILIDGTLDHSVGSEGSTVLTGRGVADSKFEGSSVNLASPSFRKPGALVRQSTTAVLSHADDPRAAEAATTLRMTYRAATSERPTTLANLPVTKPANLPVTKPANQPVTKPATQSATKPATQPTFVLVGNEVLTAARCASADPVPLLAGDPTVAIICMPPCHAPSSLFLRCSRAVPSPSICCAFLLPLRCPITLPSLARTGRSRKATVRALTECRLLQVPRAALGLTIEDVQRETVREMLPMVPVLAGLSPATYERLVGVIRYKDFGEGSAPPMSPLRSSQHALRLQRLTPPAGTPRNRCHRTRPRTDRACASDHAWPRWCACVTAAVWPPTCRLARREIIISEGDMPTAFHILCSGQVDVLKTSEASRRLATLTAHSEAAHDCHPFFGEMGFLYGRACTVRPSCAPPVPLLSPSCHTPGD